MKHKKGNVFVCEDKGYFGISQPINAIIIGLSKTEIIFFDFDYQICSIQYNRKIQNSNYRKLKK